MKVTRLGLLLCAVTCNAQALGRFADVQIIDRDSGAVLEPYRYHGEYWVAGAPGHRYSISIRNHRGDRLLAVTTVDGVNVISGETGAWGQSGYVYSPAEFYEITGWRKSDREVADFEFTASPNSYAERTGRPANVGVIGVALFLERVSPPVAYTAPQEAARSMDAQSNAAARAAPQASSDQAQSKTERFGESAIAGRAAAPLPSAKLGTGHGAREASEVYATAFERQSSAPNEVIRIRYDSWENLTAMGVLPPRALPGNPNPFPESAVSRYVADPPGTQTFIRR